MVALIAGAPPWNGIICAGTLARNLKKYSASIWEPVPTPGTAKLMVLPAMFLRNSVRLFAALVPLVTKASGLLAAMATVLKLSAENSLLANSVSLMASAVVVARSV